MPNSRTVVLTDSACDLPMELAEKSGVDILNFTIAVDGKSYVEREDFSFDEYYDMLRESDGIPSTAHITMPRFLETFEGYARRGTGQLLYVSINAGASNTFNAARQARENFYAENPRSPMKIHLLDSHTYSMAYGWFVAEASRKLQNGAELADVMAWLEDVFSRVEIILSAFSLKFIKKSGRVSAAAAFAGELLGLRPIISLIDGESVVLKKVRGDKEVLPAMLDIAAERIDDTRQYLIGATSDALDTDMAALCKDRWKAKPLTLFKLGAAVTTNTGPDAIGLVYLGEKRR